MVPGSQWGAAAAIATEDRPHGRRKGSVWWGGWAGTEHFIDPVSGIAVVFGTKSCHLPSEDRHCVGEARGFNICCLEQRHIRRASKE
ncbi:hypothetical protein BJ912DRAFT_462278 [Pholiota molesta]|nr:hypothetical protein BJ912DRAFT_462278 [Pholiota molesta]